MRVPRGFSDELRAQADIVRVISDYVSLKKRGANYLACCPFHHEKTPSFNVNPARQIFKCFGCLEENELIWTQHGLRPIGEIKVGDFVLDKHGHWREVINVIYRSSDSLLGISTEAFRYDPLWLTPDHICIYVKQGDLVAAVPYIGQASDGEGSFSGRPKHAPGIGRYQDMLHLTEGAAESLRVGDYLLFPVIPEVERTLCPLRESSRVSPRENRVSGLRVAELPVLERTARLYGLWLAEGSADCESVRFTFHRNAKDTLAAEVISILKDEFGLSARIYEDTEKPNTCEVNCSEADLAWQLTYWFGRGAHKRLPAAALFWPSSVQKALLSGYRDGGGNQESLSVSISRQLSYGLFALAIQAGENIFLSRKTRKDGYTDKTGLNHKQHWQLYPRPVESLKGFYETVDGTTYYFTPIKAIERSSGSRRVVDITVSGTSSFTTKLATVHNCGKGGDVFTFVREIESCSFPEAVRIIADKCGVALPAMDSSHELAERDRWREELLQLNQWATEFFERKLTETAEGKQALDYLAERGIAEQTQRLFRLGYAPNGWNALSDYLRSRGASRAQIERSGLVTLKEGSTHFYDRFRGRLMFPICDSQGRIVAFGGRLLGEGEPKYLNSPETALYTKGQHLFGLNYAREAIRQRGFAILVEGYMDLLLPYQAGIRNLVASLGTALTQHQVRLLGRYTRKIVVNFDPDSAGVAATKRSLEALLGEGFKVNVLTLPDNLDPDQYIRARGAESYLRLLKSSQSFLDYIVTQAISEHDQASPAGKVETLNAILPYLKLVKDRLERAEHFERIADRLKIDSRLIREEFKRAVEGRQEQLSEQAVAASLAIKPAEKKLLEILLNQPTVRRRLISEIEEEDYQALRTAKLFRLLIQLERQGLEPSYAALSRELDDEDLVQDLLPQLLIGAGERGELDKELQQQWQREAYESLYALRVDKLVQQQAALQMEINQAQRLGDLRRAGELTAQKFELAKKERALAQMTMKMSLD